MTAIIVTIAYHAVIIFGLIALVGLVGVGLYGLIRLYAFVLEQYLTAKKLRELFREFMYERMAPERKSRK